MGWIRRLGSLAHRGKLEAELDDELRFHVEQRTFDNIQAGMPPAAARAAALRAFGGVEFRKEECRDMMKIRFVEDFVQDLRYALRMLFKNPGFTAVAVVALALGIGANTAIFSVVNGVLLQPLPYHDPARLMQLSEKTAEFNAMSVAYLNYVDWSQQNRSFADMAAVRFADYDITGDGQPEHLSGKMVSADFFRVLGINPVVGRDFDPKEDRLGTTAVVIISGGLWKRRYGSSPDVIGRQIVLSGQSCTIVGAVPAGFRFGGQAEVYTLMGQWDDILKRTREMHPGIYLVARLKPGVTRTQAQSDMDGIAARLAQAYPKSNAKHGANVTPLTEVIVGDVRPKLLILLGAVGFVLLIACANVANLLLARSTGRRREMAIRSAIGAGRGRVIRQLLTESVVLALAGGAAGLAIAKWGTQAVVAAVPGGLPRMENIGIDGWVLAFTLLVSIITGLVFGLAPAIQVSVADLHETLKEGSRGSTGGRQRLRGLLVVTEVAAALVLLIGAGLMLRTIWQLNGVEPGFDPHNVLTFSVGLSPANLATPDRIRASYNQMTESIRNVPGVTSAAVDSPIPLSGEDSEAPFYVMGHPKPTSQGDMQWALFSTSGPGYLKTMGIPLLRGRYFTDQDTKNSAPVAVIDDVMARTVFPNEDPIGKSVVIAGVGNELPEFPMQIVGIVGHVKFFGLDSDITNKIRCQLYMPFGQIPDVFMSGVGGGMSLVVRTSAEPLSVLTAVRQAVLKAGNDSPVYGVQSLEQIVRDSIADRRFSMLLLGIFAALALLLAAVGIYGVISYTVAQRTHEIGIRMALGAKRGDVLRVVVAQGMLPVLAGIGLGLAFAFGLTRLMASMLYGVKASDPVTFVGVGVVLAGVAAAASFVPAFRATRIDPMMALRYE